MPAIYFYFFFEQTHNCGNLKLRAIMPTGGLRVPGMEQAQSNGRIELTVVVGSVIPLRLPTPRSLKYCSFWFGKRTDLVPRERAWPRPMDFFCTSGVPARRCISRTQSNPVKPVW